MVLVDILPDTPRDDILVCLEEFNTQAKHEARRGFTGVNGKRYRDLHETIDALCEALNVAPLVTLGVD